MIGRWRPVAAVIIAQVRRIVIVRVGKPRMIRRVVIAAVAPADIMIIGVGVFLVDLVSGRWRVGGIRAAADPGARGQGTRDNEADVFAAFHS